MGKCCLQTCSSGLLNGSTYGTQEHQARDATTHSELGPTIRHPSKKKNYHMLAQNDYCLGQVDIKLDSIHHNFLCLEILDNILKLYLVILNRAVTNPKHKTVNMTALHESQNVSLVTGHKCVDSTSTMNVSRSNSSILQLCEYPQMSTEVPSIDF